jgi:hypothetical protein
MLAPTDVDSPNHDSTRCRSIARSTCSSSLTRCCFEGGRGIRNRSYRRSPHSLLVTLGGRHVMEAVSEDTVPSERTPRGVASAEGCQALPEASQLGQPRSISAPFSSSRPAHDGTGALCPPGPRSPHHARIWRQGHGHDAHAGHRHGGGVGGAPLRLRVKTTTTKHQSTQHRQHLDIEQVRCVQLLGGKPIKGGVVPCGHGPRRGPRADRRPFRRWRRLCWRRGRARRRRGRLLLIRQGGPLLV